MEIFQPLYLRFTSIGKEFAEATQQIKALQEHLGEIHDADVLVPRLEEHMSQMLEKGYGKTRKGDLRAGVHLVDLEACQGLLTLCMQVRDERADRYRIFLDAWAELREQNLFQNLVLLLHHAADAALPRIAGEAPA